MSTSTSGDDVAAKSDSNRRTTVAVFWVVAMSLVLMLQCLRVLFPLAYSYRERAGINATLLLLVVVFVAPVFAPSVVRSLGASTAVVLCAVALACLRLSLQVVDTVPLALGALASAGALVTFGVILAVFSSRATGTVLVSAVVTGLAVDTSLRGAWGTWDVAWQRGASPMAVGVALCVVLVSSAVVAAPRASRPVGRMARAGAAVGPYLFLQVLFLQSVAFVASSGHVALASAVGIVLAGDCVALLALMFRPSGPRRRSSWAAIAIGLVAVGWWLSAATGVVAIVLVLLGQLFATKLLGRVFATSAPPSRGLSADACGLGAGSLVFGSLLVLYQIHYDVPLPVSNRWLPALASAFLGGLALTGRAATHSEVSRISHREFGLPFAVGALSVVMFCVLAITEPDPSETRASLRSLRVVSYNVHEAVTRDGELDPEAMAQAVQRLHPDVLVVQEVGRGWALSGTMDLGEWVKRRLHLPYVWVPAADDQFGNIIMSRVPIHDARVISLPKGSGTMARSAVIAHVGPVADEIVTVIGTHLQNGSSPSRRRTRIEELRVLLTSWDHQARTVLAGDLNSDPASPEIRMLLEAGFTTTQPTATCALKTSNQHCVDWILSTPDLVQSRTRTLAFDAFDHRPLVATIRPAILDAGRAP